MKFKKWRESIGLDGLFGSNHINHSSISLQDCWLEPEMEFLSSFVDEYEEEYSGKIIFCPKNDDQIFELFESIIALSEQEYCVLFAITEENNLITFVRYEEDIIKMKSKKPMSDLSEIGEMFYELDVDCFGLIVEIANGRYKVVRE